MSRIRLFWMAVMAKMAWARRTLRLESGLMSISCLLASA